MLRARPGSSSSTQMRSTRAKISAGPCARKVPLRPEVLMPAAVSIQRMRAHAEPVERERKRRDCTSPSASASAPRPCRAPALPAAASARRTAGRAAAPSPYRHRRRRAPRGRCSFICAARIASVRAEFAAQVAPARRRRARRFRPDRCARTAFRRAAAMKARDNALARSLPAGGGEGGPGFAAGLGRDGLRAMTVSWSRYLSLNLGRQRRQFQGSAAVVRDRIGLNCGRVSPPVPATVWPPRRPPWSAADRGRRAPSARRAPPRWCRRAR